MAQKRLTIDLPGSAEALRNVLRILLQYGLISENKARMVAEQGGTAVKPVKKDRWALVAEEMSEQGYLKGKGEELLETIRDFREDFEIPGPFAKAAR